MEVLKDFQPNDQLKLEEVNTGMKCDLGEEAV